MDWRNDSFLTGNSSAFLLELEIFSLSSPRLSVESVLDDCLALVEVASRVVDVEEDDKVELDPFLTAEDGQNRPPLFRCAVSRIRLVDGSYLLMNSIGMQVMLIESGVDIVWWAQLVASLL
jgi:hypothetical protein